MRRSPLTASEADHLLHGPGATGDGYFSSATTKKKGPAPAGDARAPTRRWTWRLGARRGFDEIIDDEEAFWTELFRIHNLGLAFCYTLVGFVPSLITTPLSIYLVQEINAQPTTQNQVAICTSLPWAFKLAFGFLSDAVPLFGGQRRKPYIFLGTCLSAAAYLALASIGRPSAPALGLGLCLATVGAVMADTMADALVVERSRTEPEGDHGHLQSALYAYRFGGAVAGAVAGALLYNKNFGWGFGLSFAQIMAGAGLLPLVLLLPLLWPLREMPLAHGHRQHRRHHHEHATVVELDPEGSGGGGAAEIVEIGAGGEKKEMEGEDEEKVGVMSVSDQMRQIWEIVQLPIVYLPMLFVYVYNLLQIPNVAWTSFLVLNLNFTPYLLGSLALSSRVMVFLGVLLYKRFFLRSAWPLTYVWTTLLTAFFSVCQLLLIFQVNAKLGISNFIFALGDDALASFVVGIQFLPLCMQYLTLCPGGSEGASYSMLTTFGNVALLAGNSLGTLFGGIWDVSNGALRAGELGGLWRLTVLTSCLSPLPLLLLPLLPADAAQQKAMREASRTSPLAGVLFLVTLFASLSWIVAQAVYVLLLNETG